MILQNYYRFNSDIEKYGCYFMSIIFLASHRTSTSFPDVEIMKLYDIFVDKEWMSEHCYVMNPEAMFEFLRLPVHYTNKHEVPWYQTRLNEIEVLCYLRSYNVTNPNGEKKDITYKHFVAGDGHGHVAYDPLGMSNAVRHGHLDSKRIFVLE